MRRPRSHSALAPREGPGKPQRPPGAQVTLPPAQVGTRLWAPGGSQARTEAAGGRDSLPVSATLVQPEVRSARAIHTRVLRMNTCGREVCSGQAMCKGPHAHRRDKSQGVCRGRQQEGAGPAAMRPGCPPRGRQDGPCPLGLGSPPTRRRAGGGRGSRHWGPCRHSRDRQRGSGGGSERGRNRGGRQRWARVAAAVGTHASAQAR